MDTIINSVSRGRWRLKIGTLDTYNLRAKHDIMGSIPSIPNLTCTDITYFMAFWGLNCIEENGHGWLKREKGCDIDSGSLWA